MRGQARKSLWIETLGSIFSNHEIPVRLVRACGSKHFRYYRPWFILLVRLVRACGSKLRSQILPSSGSEGQARKSLWIETSWASFYRLLVPQVTLDIASVDILPGLPSDVPELTGQARKSLWIETKPPAAAFPVPVGQARKSLWIETTCSPSSSHVWPRSGS